MEKLNKNTIWIVLAILIIVVGSLLWIFLGGKDSSSPQNTNAGTPFGTPGNESSNNSGAPFGSISQDNPFLPPVQNSFSSEKKLNRLSEAPVSGATITTSGSSTVVRYMDKATGHVYEVTLPNGERIRLSNVTIPKVGKTIWRDKDFLLAQTVENGFIKTIVGTIASSTSSSTEERLLTKNLGFGKENALFSPSKKSGLYTSKGTSGIQLFTTDKLLEKPVLVWSFPTSEWLIEWPKEDTITLTTKPSHGVPGYMYALNPSTKANSKILNDIPGLTTLSSPDGLKVLYGASGENTSSLFLYDLKNRSSVALGIKTLPEKCVWGSKNIYCAVPTNLTNETLPDLWYQGVISFKDSLWSISFDGEEGLLETESVKISEIAGGNIDLIEPTLSGDEKTLIFTNKLDGILWALSL